MKEEIKYVAYVCVNSLKNEKDKDYCNNIWIDKDEVDAFINPPDYKYCAECVKKGFKNNKKARDNYKPVVNIERYIYNWQSENKDLPKKDSDFVYNKCIEILNEYREFNKKINTQSIFKQALEIFSYYKEEENNENKTWR